MILSMPRSRAFALAFASLLLVFPAVAVAQDTPPAAASSTAAADADADEDEGVALRYRGPRQVLVGQRPTLRFEIVNRTDATVETVKPLYDSLRHRRYPKVTVELRREGKPLELDLTGGPLKQKELYESSLFALVPGARMEFEIDWPFEQDGVSEPGPVRLRVLYDTRAGSVEAWNAWPEESVSAADNLRGRREMSARLANVPPMLLEATADVRVYALDGDRIAHMVAESSALDAGNDSRVRAAVRDAFASGAVRVASVRPSAGATIVALDFEDDFEPPVGARLLREPIFVVEPPGLRPGRVAPFDGFEGGRFILDPLSRVPLWRLEQLGPFPEAEADDERPGRDGGAGD